MKIFNTIAVIIFLAVVGFIVYKVSSDTHRKYYETTVPVCQTIERRLYLPGSVRPIKEVEIKSQLSGVLDELYVEIGQYVRKGTPVATIRRFRTLRILNNWKTICVYHGSNMRLNRQTMSGTRNYTNNVQSRKPIGKRRRKTIVSARKNTVRRRINSTYFDEDMPPLRSCLIRLNLRPMAL